VENVEKCANALVVLMLFIAQFSASMGWAGASLLKANMANILSGLGRSFGPARRKKVP
jgi:hypothetical protein